MKIQIFLTFFLLLLPVLGVNAQESEKITEALDENVPSELILEPETEADASVTPVTPVVPVTPVESEKAGKPERSILESEPEILPENQAETLNGNPDAKASDSAEKALPDKLPEVKTPASAQTPARAEGAAPVHSPVAPDVKMTVVPPPVPRKTAENTQVPENLLQNTQVPETVSPASAPGLVPFHPAQQRQAAENAAAAAAADSEPVSDPAAALDALFRKYHFPYPFIRVTVMSENAASQSFGDSVQLSLPVIVSFDAEALTAFHAEMKALLTRISLSPPENILLQNPYASKNLGRRNIFLGIHIGGETYTMYELPEVCRPVLAQYAALLPVAEVSLYDENQNVLARHFLPLLYRGIVKAYPINLLAVYQGDYQILRIYPHQADSFEAFIEAQGSSFVIPKRFPLVSAHTASDWFLGKNAKYFFLETSFRQTERLTQIPFMTQVTISEEQFRNIRFIQSRIAADAPGEAEVQPTEAFELSEAEVAEMTDGNAEGEKVSIVENRSDSENALLSAETPVSQAEIEASVQKAISQQKSMTLSFYGEKEKNITLSGAVLKQLAGAFRISKFEQTQIFDDTPELDLASLGWLEIMPGTSIMFLFPEGAAEETVPELNPKAALWLSRDDGKLTFVRCELDAAFIAILKQTLR